MQEAQRGVVAIPEGELPGIGLLSQEERIIGSDPSLDDVTNPARWETGLVSELLPPVQWDAYRVVPDQLTSLVTEFGKDKPLERRLRGMCPLMPGRSQVNDATSRR